MALAAAEQEQRFRDQQKRAENAEAEARALREQVAALSKEEQPKLPTEETSNGFDSLVDNLSVLRNLVDEEVNELRSQANEMGVDPIKFAKSKAWQSHLETIRTSKQTEARTPEPSHRTAVFEGKTFQEVVLGDTTPEAKQQAFVAQRDALLNRGRNQMI